MHIHEPAHVELARHGLGCGRDLGEHFFRKRKRRDNAGAVAAMDTGLLDMLHDPSDYRDLAVTDAIHIDFHGVLQKSIHQDRPIR